MPGDILLFQEQNKFIYDVFLTIFHIPMGVHFIHTHEGARDAQAIWKHLTSYMHTSTTADIIIEDLIGWMTSRRLYTIIYPRMVGIDESV